MMRRKIFICVALLAVVACFVSNRASAQTCAKNIPHINGTWVTLPYQMPINPISASLLLDGKVLIIAGSENDMTNNSKGAESYRAAVWDPTRSTENGIAIQNLTYDVFCSGTAALPDGRSLIVGGTSDYTFTGENRASIFNPATHQFVQSQSMVDGRWYGTATTLGDGRIMAMSGLKQNGGVSRTVEIYDLRNAGAGWSAPTSVPFTPPLYPRVALLPNGTVFYTGQGSGGNNANAYIFNPATGSWTASAPSTRNRSYGSSVLLPLQPPELRSSGHELRRRQPGYPDYGDHRSLRRITTWVPGPNMSAARIQMNAVILPNGKVLAEGGSVNNESPDTQGRIADLYDPVRNTHELRW